MRQPALAGSILVLSLGYSLVTAAQAAPGSAGFAKGNSSPELTALLESAYGHFYDLEYDRSIAEFERALQTDPENFAYVNRVLQAELFRELYRLNLLDTTLYAREGQGFLAAAKPPNADPKVRERIMQLSDQAIGLEEASLKRNSNEVDALFARGQTRGYRSTYLGLVDKNFLAAVRMSLGARSDHERVLHLDPGYLDAKLVVGVDNFVVGSLPLAFRMMVGMVGITGDRKRGLEYLQEVAEHSATANVDARIALALFLRREARYGEALQEVRVLTNAYPRNFLFALEEANLLKDSGQGREAIAAYRNVVEKSVAGGYADPHTELAWFGLAECLRGQKDLKEALAKYAAVEDASRATPELRQRASLAAGEIFDVMDERDQALRQYRATIAFDAASEQAESARKLLKSPYREP